MKCSLARLTCMTPMKLVKQSKHHKEQKRVKPLFVTEQVTQHR